MDSIIEYKPTVFYDNIQEISPYQGEPSDEKDAMWLALYDSKSTLSIFPLC